MTAGSGGLYDILRSGAVLTQAESNIMCSITDVQRWDGTIKIVCQEVPAQDYTLALYGTYKDAAEGDTLIANMQSWFGRVETLEDEVEELSSNLDVTEISANDVITGLDSHVEVIKIYRCGHTVMFRMRITQGLTADADTKIGTFTTLKPVVEATSIFRHSGGNTLAPVYVTATGEIYCRANSSAAYYSGSLVWLTND